MGKIVDEIDRCYKTLGRDIEIYRRDQAAVSHLYHNNREIGSDELDGRWDRKIYNGDFIQAKGDQSVYNAITLAILTGFRELENKGLPSYNNFGNRSYELLKENKNRMTLYKLESYFTESINRIRRVRNVVELQVREYDVHSFDVNFTVETIKDTRISGSLVYDKNKRLSHSFIEVELVPSSGDFVGPGDSCSVSVRLSNTRGSSLSDKLLRLYLDDELYSYGVSDDNGEYTFIIPNKDLLETRIYHVNVLFEGDDTFYPVETGKLKIISTQYRFLIEAGRLRMMYNPEAPVPNFKVEDGRLWVDRSTGSDEYKIESDLFINMIEG